MNVTRAATIVFFGAYALTYIKLPFSEVVAAVAAAIACIGMLVER